MTDLFRAGAVEKHSPRAVVPGQRRLKLLQPATSAQAIPATTLWIAIYLPRLALHAVTESKEAAVVIETQAGRSLIIAVNEAAAASAVTDGMTVSAALSLCNELHMHERDPVAECRLLNKVAALAYRFSDSVALYTTDSIVLEIYGSLKLFGGANALQQAVQQQLHELKLQAILCVAPTARAATWLALCRQTAPITDLPALKRCLRSLPAGLIAVNNKTAQQFQNCGILTLGDYMRLPHKDVNRRFGLQALRLLQQALGEYPEPLQYYKPPEPFHAVRDFDDPVITCELVEKTSAQLLQKLQQHLHARCAAIQYIVLFLAHTDKSISTLRIGSSHYQRNSYHLEKLLHECLHNHVLKQPVLSIGLHADELHVLPAASMDLFAGHTNNQQDWQQLLDILQTRLGRQAIKPLSACDDPRPEYAYRFTAERAATRTNRPQWPFWLLETPQQLDGGQLIENLKPETGAERIEQGWWSGSDIRRDYYRVQDKEGVRHWVYQDCRSKQWYLHGLFG
jgi:protein ImuB